MTGTEVVPTPRPAPTPTAIKALDEIYIYAKHLWLRHAESPHPWCEQCRLTTERFYRAHCERANAINAWLGGEVISVDELLVEQEAA